MPDLLDQKTARKLLAQHGWTCTAGGKHNVKMEKEGRRPITLPRHGGQTYGKGLSAAILRAPNTMSGGSPGRAGRHAAASSVAPIPAGIGAPCVLASHSTITPSQRAIIELGALRQAGLGG